MKLREFDIFHSWSHSWLLAQDPVTSPFELPIPVLIALMFALFFFIILRPQQKKDKKFREMLDGLKEKDRVVTLGGIHGVVTNVQRDRDEVTIRIDESTGTKIRVGTSAIVRLVTDEDKNEKKT